MNKTGQCTKCDAFEAVRVPGGQSRPRIGTGPLSSVKVVLYVCCACGYVEHWIDDTKALPHVAKHYGDG